MNALVAFHFIRPWWLLLLPLAFVLWWLERREADTTIRWRAVMDAPLLAALTVGGSGPRLFDPGNLMLAGWVIGTIALAGPTWREVPSPFAQSARPAIFVLKVTPSMQGRDVAPTRLDRAREKLDDLLKLREGAPTGLVAYAGSVHLVVPPTADASVVITMARALAPEVMPAQGDALADAVSLARRTLMGGGQGGSVVVFADTAPMISGPASGGPPVTLFAMLPPARAASDAALRAAAGTLGASLQAPSIDTADVEELARKLVTAGPPPPAPGEAPRWEEDGWWLTPFLAFLVAFWFRRGWVAS